MKILVVCQHYYPEPFRITDICEELVKRNHDVTVLTGVPNYPMGKIYDGYKNKKRRYEEINGVKVHRSFTIGRRTGIFWRILNYYSFSISSQFYVNRFKEKFDVVLINQLSPIMMANAGIRYKKRTGTKILHYCMDLWPESLIAGGIKRNSLIYKFFHSVSGKIYRKADKILITSRSFEEYLIENFGIKKENIEYLPQYSEALFNFETCRKEQNGNLDLMFAGNIGAVQCVDAIIRAATLTLDEPKIKWHIVGDGSEYESCKKLSQELKTENVIFHGRQSLEEMPKYYSMADVMLVTMTDDPVISKTLPGKVQSYMAAGKPIIATSGGETERVINKARCGLCFEAGNEKSLAQCAQSLLSGADLKMYGDNALKYHESHFSKDMFFLKLNEEFKKIGTQ